MNKVLQPVTTLDQDQLHQLEEYLKLVLEVNQGKNLTAITDWEEAVNQLGLIAVPDDEVGVFWSIGAY